MEQLPLSKEQEESLQAAKDRGLALQGIVNADGWRVLTAYYEAQIKAFTTAVLSVDLDIAKFEAARREIIGIRKLFGYVENSIKELSNEPRPVAE